MAWGSSSKAPPPPPLCIKQASSPPNLPRGLSKSASDKMAAKNVSFTKDGVKVGVKEMKNESYVDKTQGFLIKAWNLSSWPAYQSRLGWGKETGNGNGNSGQVEARKPFSRSSSTR
ncbi:hypothetical protein DID88_001755 [Monilinia fructigena]|uniref:Uncharacterized protein n=1 Tax=Monilinia fructigena TaxID=38457 RepID=A0A395IXW7_9HELO|nr:hypothetical protein DID88_001755 [Monilinia fructigena]